MILEGTMSFGLPAITNSNTATVSSNIWDAGSAKKIFTARRGPRLKGRQAVSQDTTGIKIDFVGADNTALTSNAVVIASTGVIAWDELGAALGSGTQNVEFDIPINGQTIAKQYYGLLVTLSGTNPDSSAGNADICLDAQTNMTGARAAVP